jgi:hypothetical protein
VRALAVLLLIGVASNARAQGLPTEPVSLGDGRVVIGAEVSATVAPEDPGFFNFTDYEYSTLRNVRLGMSAEVRATARLQFLGEVRLDHGNSFQPYGLYARIRPWPHRRFDIQVGRVPPTFGAVTRRTYATDNLLIGTPLGYQYLTSLRTDAVPADADELLRMRGRGWLTAFSIGNTTAEAGLPVINGFRWDTGVQVHAVAGVLEWTASVTTGTLSNPRVDDDNGGRQIAGRVVWRPLPAVVAGFSAGRGAFLSQSLASALPDARVEDLTQRAFGGDVEYSAGRALIRGELIWSRWSLPIVRAPMIEDPLDALVTLVEGRYGLWPGLYVAARAERLGFSEIMSSAGRLPWDAPVRRMEAGLGWSIIRNVMIKASVQRNERDGGRVRHETLAALQALYWF